MICQYRLDEQRWLLQLFLGRVRKMLINDQTAHAYDLCQKDKCPKNDFSPRQETNTSDWIDQCLVVVSIVLNKHLVPGRCQKKGG